MKTMFTLGILISNLSIQAQDSLIVKDSISIPKVSFDYSNKISEALQLFNDHNYSKAIETYSLAFKNNNDKGLVRDRYKMACCYAALNHTDKAFEQLFRIAEKGRYYNFYEIEKETFFISLQDDERWKRLISIIKDNANKIQETLNSGKYKNE